MLGELVTTNTEDRVRLDGFHVPPQGAPRWAFDAVVVVHGLAGNFYGSRLLKHLAFGISDHGIAAVIANTRGHDYLNVTVRSGRSQTNGSAVERVDECPFDLNGWTDYFVERGAKRVLWLGHSLGAIKSLYAAAHRRHGAVVGVAGLSATRLSQSAFENGPAQESFRMCLNLARQRVQGGRGEELIRVDFPFPTWMSAEAYVEKYGSADKYDWTTFVARIDVPVWLAFGQIELDENPAFQGLRDQWPELRRANPRLAIEEIERADHFYSATFHEATAALYRWLDDRFEIS